MSLERGRGFGDAGGFRLTAGANSEASAPACPLSAALRPFSAARAPLSTAGGRLLCGAMLAGALAAVAAGLSGCQGIEMGAAGMAQLRVIDASPDAPAIDSYQNNAALAYGLGFGTVTSYVPMAPGTYTLAADKTGTRQALVASPATLNAGHQYTSIVGNAEAALQQTILQDQSTPAPAGQIAVRIVDQATRAGALDVYLIPKGSQLLATAPVAVNLSFGSNSGYLNLPAGTYELAVLPAGTAPVASTVTLLSGAQVDYASGAVRTVVLIDAPAAPSASDAALTTARPAAGVQAIIADDCDPPNS